MKIEEVLTAVPPAEWKVGKVYSFEYYDGPRAGVCSLVVPPVEFQFDLLDERSNPDGLDDRLFRLSELPAGSVAEVLSVVRDLASPDPAARIRADECLRLIQAQARRTSLVLLTQDMRQFLGIWEIETLDHGTDDWFSRLGIPQELTT